ncbi:MAG: adenylate/guanylate cyclase domain-containing protein [Myxococcota bacterium]
MSIPGPVEELRVAVPLWTKLGALFGGVYGVAVASYGYWDWQELVREEIARRQSELETLAQVIAGGIDGEAHASFRLEADRARPEFAAIGDTLRYTIDRSDTIDWASTCTRDDLGHWQYVVDGSHTAPYPVGFPIFDGTSERDLAFEGRIRYVDALEDDSGTWHTVFAPIRTPDGAVVGLVELASDADRDDLVLAGRFRRTVAQFATAVGGGALLSFAFGRLLSRHLGALVASAQRVAAGELDAARVEVRTRDEIGVLAATFNRMVDGLREREFIRDTFGRFVNPAVVAQILEDRSRLRLGGEAKTVTVLMSDLRGFTALSEELGPERMVALLNRYLARMTEVVEGLDGNVAELLGDGLVVLFGAPVSHPDDARRAVVCAVTMHRELAAFNAAEGRRLQMGIGIDTGEVVAGNIGAERHMKYGVVGAAINVAARLESFTLGNQVLITEATRDAAGAGAIDTDQPLEFRAKGRREPIRAYPVRGVGANRMPDDLAHAHIDVSLRGTVWRVDGKQVELVGHPVTVIKLEPEAITVRGGPSLRERDKVKLALALDRTPLTDLYGTVQAASEDRALVHLTSVPTEVRAAIEAYIDEMAGEATGPRLP